MKGHLKANEAELREDSLDPVERLIRIEELPINQVKPHPLLALDRRQRLIREIAEPVERAEYGLPPFW